MEQTPDVSSPSGSSYEVSIMVVNFKQAQFTRQCLFGGISLNSWRRRRLVGHGFLLFPQQHYGALQTIILRLMFIGFCLIGLPFWGMASILPRLRERGDPELHSSFDFLRSNLRTEIEAL